jgi:hypothetical protein
MFIFSTKSQSFLSSDFPAEVTIIMICTDHTTDNFPLPSANGAYTPGGHDGYNMQLLLVKTSEEQLLARGVFQYFLIYLLLYMSTCHRSPINLILH